MRGKAVALLWRSTRVWITPAHAGKSAVDGSPIALHGDHPPRMRGKANPSFAQNPSDGITPAHAGKSHSADARQCSAWDHPRACGEKSFGRRAPMLRVGSPPRMRGKARRVIHDLSRVGITPAHAGKRKSEGLTGLQSRDHPRTCGEKLCWKHRRLKRQGSPPHMRGKDPYPCGYAG